MINSCLLQFSKSGLHTVVQDEGRFSYQKFGVPVGGAMDQKSAAIANWLVGNELSSPTLEVTFIGPSFTVEGNCQMAITGADLSATINGELVPLHKTLNVGDGSLISFGRNKAGCRAYIGIGGTWKIRPWLQSVSATPFSTKQITPDSIISDGDYLKVNTRPQIKARSFVADRDSMQDEIEQPIRILPGPEFDFFSPITIGTFFSNSYRISPQSNRMGYRLEGNIPDFKPKHELISSGCLPGTIQITNSGQPIVLMADAQTTGGYYRLGNVIRVDLDRLAQIRPGDYVRFQLINYGEAQELLATYSEWRNALKG